MREIPEELLKPPAGIGEAATRFWESLRAKVVLDDNPFALALGQQAVLMLDELEICRTDIAKHGYYFTTRRGQPAMHPAAIREKTLVNELGKIFRLLGLDQEPKAADKQAKLWR
jgi:hypothetical protein